MNPSANFENPYRPGAGHQPPHLAGRKAEKAEFRRLLKQTTVTENLILTGLRGVGKTVLLDTFKPVAVEAGWLWCGTDLSESASISEAALALRVLTDLSVVASMIEAPTGQLSIGFKDAVLSPTFTFNNLQALHSATPGLATDKLKKVLEAVWASLERSGKKGIVFAYDEAQTMSDQHAKEEFPLSTLLDVFQSIQRKGIPFMLVLAGLPTLFPKCVEARTFSERMFRVLTLDRLSDAESRSAIEKPVKEENCPVSFNEPSVSTIVKLSSGYPFFIQFICREAFDVVIQKFTTPGAPVTVPTDEIIRKLDTDFFAGRWARATDRQRELLTVAAQLENAGAEFTVQELVEGSQRLLKPFGSSHVNQMLASLSHAGLVYKNRYGKYSFAVPLLHEYIRRQIADATNNQV